MRLTIDNIEIESSASATILEAALDAGISIPHLCFHKETGGLTSCMVCVVKEMKTGKMIPACSARVTDGMQIVSDDVEVRAARREILRMLLTEHAGDCEAPCSRICPAALNIPRMLRYISAGDIESAAKLAQRDLIFPATLGWICPAPCKKGCRRASYDTAIDIPAMHRNLEGDSRRRLSSVPHSGKTVAVVGAGVAGLSAAAVSVQNGHACHVYERNATACAGLRTFPPGKLPPEVLDTEIAAITSRGVEIHYQCEAGTDLQLQNLTKDYDAVIIACDWSFPAHEKIFAANEDRLVVRAVGNGKMAAYAADAFLNNTPRKTLRAPFNSHLGKLNPEELSSYAVERTHQGLPAEDLRAEAVRCLHCDCLKPLSCKLRQYAEEYGVLAGSSRPPLQPILASGEILFERGKCIKCGICVELLCLRGSRLGLTFMGRGAQSIVGIPFDVGLARALGDFGVECVRACPTGALAIRSEEETA